MLHIFYNGGKKWLGQIQEAKTAYLEESGVLCGKKAGKIRLWGPRGALAPLLSLCFYSADALLLLIFYSAAENSAERWEAQTEKIRDGGSQENKLKNPD